MQCVRFTAFRRLNSSLTMPLSTELAKTLASRTSAEVRFRKIDRILYATDASNYRVEPLGVVLPRTAEDVAETVRIAGEFGVSVLPRGGGTGLAGQCLGDGIAVDMSKYMDGVPAIDAENKTATVQPGVTIGRLNALAGEKGLMFGPDPASAKVATAGGVVASNGTGAHSILYGMAGDNLLSAKAVLATGDEVSLSASGCSDARLSKALEDFRGANRALVERDFPRHWRRASGYSLDCLLDDNFNPAKLLASSEGTLALTTELTLKLVDTPARTALCVLQFDDLFRAIESVPLILRREPSAVELIDGMLIGLTRKHGGYSRMLSFVKGEPEAVLAVEFFGETDEDCRKKAEGFAGFLTREGVRCEKGFALSQSEQAMVWGVRTAGLGLLMSSRSGAKPIPCIEDVSVPVSSLAAYVKDISEVFSSMGLTAGYYAHASAGCLHIRPLIDLSTREGAAVMDEVSDAALGLALKHGGVMSGEHGDGLQRSRLNERLFGADIYGAMKDLKHIFDPADALNPGKVVSARRDPGATLRAAGADPSRLAPVLDWSASGGLAPEVAACNGQGLCRKTGDGAMCPSFMATRDEAHTTRARANLLRAVLHGEVGPDFIFSKEAEEVFGLCVGCKACKTECPSSVDVAKMKTEFLAQRGKRAGFSLTDKMFARAHAVSSVLSRAPAAANLLADAAAGAGLTGLLGIAPQRRFPALARRRFSDWFSARGVSAPAGAKAVYFHDTWAEFFNPGAGRGAVEILEALGFEVAVEERRVCCGRPMMSRGMVAEARANAEINVSVLAPYAERGIPIIGTEPSCVSMFTDDYADLLPQSGGREAVGRMFFTLEEFVKPRAESLSAKLDIPAGRVIAHTHCHGRAAGSSLGETLDALGFDSADTGAGCCGMAGGFGYEKKYYDVSEKMASDRLVPSIEKAGRGARVCATGVSCMEQIRHFSGAEPVHFARLVADCIRR